MSFHFFTEPSKLATQASGQTFGAIDTNQYRLGNMFAGNGNGNPKAFAVTGGIVLAQQIGTSGRYSLVIKPDTQPDLGMPKINYIIYKGIAANSIIDGAKVAAATQSDLTSIVHANVAAWYANKNLPVPNTEPNAEMSLGLVYTATQADVDYQKADTAFLDDAFYATNEVTLPRVEAGHTLGEFDAASDFGIVVIFEKIGYRPHFGLARELDSVLSFTALNSPTDAQSFERKHKKEVVSAFIDPAAFFGAFYSSSLEVHEGTTVATKAGDQLYTDVISKFLNCNKVYLDLRNEYDDSFNYYENYANQIRWNLTGNDTSPLASVDYYRNGWPVMVILGSEFTTPSGTDKIMRLALPNHDNEYPLIYLKRAYRADVGLTTLPQNSEKFITPIDNAATVNINNLVALNRNLVWPRSADLLVANYFHIKYIKRSRIDDDDNTTDSTHVPVGKALFKRSYLDNIFPIFEMQMPFTTAGTTNLKMYYDVTHIDKIVVKDIPQAQILGDYTLRDYTSSLGIAKDSDNVTFLSFPFLYNANMNYNNDVLPLGSMEAGGNPFLIELNGLISSVNLVRSTFDDNGTEVEYLRFENNTASDGTTFTPTNYTFRDVLIFSITNTEFAAMETAVATEFPGGYKIYLGIKDITPIDSNGTVYYKFNLVMRGLRVVGNTVQPHFYETGVEAYSDADILGVNSGHVFPVAKGYIEEDYGEIRSTGKMHKGIDIENQEDATTYGSPILAARGGTIHKIVKRSQLLHHGGADDDLAGIRIQILGDNGYYYYYFHMGPNSNDAFTVGDAITAGQQIGTIGKSGNGYENNAAWTQAHLHFEIWTGPSANTKISPYRVFPELALLPFDVNRDQ